MAGRGQDIKLGGKNLNPNNMEEHNKVKELGGLFVIGTERHESRRIDNQLRGRSGRQGDQGNSIFYISLEDDLMRIFGSESIDTIMKKFGLKEGESIDHPWINKALERAQQKVEGRNFDIRKTLLKFDDVMNDQRKVIFEQRKEILKSNNVNDVINSFLEDLIINFLKDIGEYDNTIIVFMSDNGAAGEDFYYNNTYGNYIQKHFTYAYEEMGKPNSFVSLGVAWAESITAPFKLYKGYATSGGMRSPLIIKGLENNKLSVTDKFLSILDIAPSLYDYLEIDYPKIFNSYKIEPLDGISILPYIDGYKEEIHSKNDVFAFEHSGNVMLKKGNWKIINLNQPFEIDNFNLYSTKDDISELYDKKIDSINVYNELIMEWEKFSKSKKLIFPTPYIDNLN